MKNNNIHDFTLLLTVDDVWNKLSYYSLGYAGSFARLKAKTAQNRQYDLQNMAKMNNVCTSLVLYAKQMFPKVNWLLPMDFNNDLLVLAQLNII